MKKRVRQTDVARLAGVSPATVSLVINNRSGGSVRISEETRQRVLDAVNQLSYVVDPAARSLAGGQNAILGVFTFEAIFPLTHRDFYYPFLVGIEEGAEELGYDLLLFTSAGHRTGMRRIYRSGVNRLRMADGAVLLGNEGSKEELQRLVDEGYPFVFVGRREVARGDIAYAGADYTSATARVVEEMMAIGHRRIAYLGTPVQTESLLDRREGYRRALRAGGYDVDPSLLCLCADDEIQPEFLGELESKGVTAVVVETGTPAPRFIRVCRERGVQIPRDLSLAMLGDPTVDYDFEAGITMFRIPRREMGQQAIRLLAALLADDYDGQRQIVLPCEFVPGSTLMPPKLAR